MTPKRVRSWQCSCNYQTMVVDHAEIERAHAEISKWKAKYIEARQSGYLEGKEEARAEVREVIK